MTSSGCVSRTSTRDVTLEREPHVHARTQVAVGKAAAIGGRAQDLHRPEVGLRGHDADDRRLDVVQPDRSTNDVRSALELALPQPIADEREVRSARHVFGAA